LNPGKGRRSSREGRGGCTGRSVSFCEKERGLLAGRKKDTVLVVTKEVRHGSLFVGEEKKRSMRERVS